MVAECLAPDKADFTEELAKQRVQLAKQLTECKADSCSPIADFKASLAEMVASETEAKFANYISLRCP